MYIELDQQSSIETSWGKSVRSSSVSLTLQDLLRAASEALLIPPELSTPDPQLLVTYLLPNADSFPTFRVEPSLNATGCSANSFHHSSTGGNTFCKLEDNIVNHKTIHNLLYVKSGCMTQALLHEIFIPLTVVKGAIRNSIYNTSPACLCLLY